jgi:glutamyl/glutaminyl-tRNA synthetase
VVKTSVHLLPQFGEAIRFVTEYVAPEIDRDFATAVAADLREHGEPGDADAVKAMNERLKKATGLKGKDLFMPLRLMLTGMDHGPELVRAIPLLARAGQSDPRVLSPLARAEQCIR